MYELVEPIEKLNYKLQREYGRMGESAIWRISWSEDQLEYRRGNHIRRDNSGNITGEYDGVEQVKKYNYVKERYILERIMPVPDINRDELLTDFSYEPVFVFENGKKEYLPPRWEVCQFVIEAIMKAASERVGVKYPEPNTEELMEEKRDRIKRLQEELFGNETDTGDSLGAKEGIIVP